ncbi:MAG: hypothetical protein JRJ75_15830 [Deltaproteobacteria bacterium]|nr:hypothetical protein [Deltaproteobacteria bacterium]
MAVPKGIVDGRPYHRSIGGNYLLWSSYHRSIGGNYLLWSSQVIIAVPVVYPSYPDKERISGPTRTRRPPISPYLLATGVILPYQTLIRVYKVRPFTANL